MDQLLVWYTGGIWTIRRYRFYDCVLSRRLVNIDTEKYALRLNASISPDKYRQVRYPRVKLLL